LTSVGTTFQQFVDLRMAAPPLTTTLQVKPATFEAVHADERAGRGAPLASLDSGCHGRSLAEWRPRSGVTARSAGSSDATSDGSSTRLEAGPRGGEPRPEGRRPRAEHPGHEPATRTGPYSDPGPSAARRSQGQQLRPQPAARSQADSAGSIPVTRSPRSTPAGSSPSISTCVRRSSHSSGRLTLISM
jgi:hypothetical protein